MLLRDPISSTTHWMACLWALFATLILWRLTSGDRLRRISVTVFGLSMVLLYGASGTFHAVTWPPTELQVLQKLDQTAIYGLIAGTYTPIMALLLHGKFRLALLALMWTFAAVGVLLLWVLPKAPHSAMVGIFLGMGWLGCLGIVHYYRAVGLHGLFWAMLGAGFYTFGAICDLCVWPTILPGVIGPHEVFHICDIGGTWSHFVFIVRFVLPFRRV